MPDDNVARPLPKNALQRVQIGQSFAEYDQSLKRPDIFVHTPAFAAADNFDNSRCFFVGRRGTGKTTITKYLEGSRGDVYVVRPDLFSPVHDWFTVEALQKGNARPFKSLVAAFKCALLGFALHNVPSVKQRRAGITQELRNEIDFDTEYDFDLAALGMIDRIMRPLVDHEEREWHLEIKRPKTIIREINDTKLLGNSPLTILFDAIDESWDGSSHAVIYLAALMHATLEFNTQLIGARVLVFLRENIFERVRVVDSEFARLETCVVGLDWTKEQLLEMVERRLNSGLTAKLPLKGATWDSFFEGEGTREAVFDYCQNRPRDVLTYVSLAIDNAQSHDHSRILLEDLYDARRRFSTSRLSDLGDEYQENYPQISLVLSRFYGLGRRWTSSGLGSLLARLLSDKAVKSGCAEWIYRVSQPEQFARLLYDIGFVGFIIPQRDGSKRTMFRSVGPRDTTPPPISPGTDLAIHPTYWEALDLQDVLVTEFKEGQTFGSEGLIEELPNSWDMDTYVAEISNLEEALKSLAPGEKTATAYEDIVGDVLRLCFFRYLANVEDQVRTLDHTQRRDWLASNRAENGFWAIVRQRYDATQVVFECKNYAEIGAPDFQQLAYYLDHRKGRLGFLCFRGEISRQHWRHVKECLDNKRILILPLTDKDLGVFLRQARNGKVKDSHLADKLDSAERL